MMIHAQERAEERAGWLRSNVRSIDAQEQDVIRLSGNVDFERSSEIRKILLGAVAGKRDVFVDLSKVTYMDSSGIACLVEALQIARDHGANLGLLSVSLQTLRVLELARLDMVFPILGTCQAERAH